MRLIALFLTLCLLLTVPAMAAGPDAENDKAKVTVVEGVGATVEFDSTNPEIINVTVTSTSLVAGDQYVVLMVKSADGVNYAIEEGSILYINQTETAGAVAAADGKASVSFGVYPSALEDSVILIAGAKDGLIKAAVVQTKGETFVLGDVDGNGSVDANDLVLLARYMVGAVSINELNKNGANVDKIGEIDANDLVLLARVLVGDTKLD